MKFQNFFCIVLCLFYFSIQVCGQEISATVVDNSAEVEFTVSDLQDLTNGGEYENAHYQVFLNYGDGNYLRSPELLDTEVTFIHEYLMIDNSYSPTALFIERKTSNPIPPPGIIAPRIIPEQDVVIEIDERLIEEPYNDYINYPSSMINYEDDKEFCRRLGIDHSHFLEDFNWSAFILGYRPIENLQGGLFLFYDNDDNVEELFEKFFSKGSKYGDYTIDGSRVEKRKASDFIISNPYEGQPVYSDVLYFPINNEEGSLDAEGDNTNYPEELRLFHYLKANEFKPGFDYKFLAILGSEIPKSTGESLVDSGIECRNFNWEEDNVFASNYVHEDFSIKTNNFTSKSEPLNFQYIDAVEYETKKGDPEDPNKIEITKICECEENGKYKATFKLTFCNISPVPTESATIYSKI